MTYLKRFFFFALVNILIVITLSIIVAVLESYFGFNLQSNYGSMIILYGIFGMGGAFFSLFTSKWMAKRGMGVQVIALNTTHPTEKWLLNSVHTYAQKAGLKNMPEVGIYAAREMNAFATGPSKNNSLVAVSSGLLESMGKDEVEGVIGHEVAHIANGDMVTMTLIQGVVNSIVMVISRIITDVVASKLDEKGRGFARFGIYMLVSTVLALLGSIVVNWFSRHREFRADHGGAMYAGKEKMIKALVRLQEGQGRAHNFKQENEEPIAIAALKISSPTRGSFLKKLFMTHPPLEERIHALKVNSL
jgi:heat shock protein HtpX